MDHTVRKKLPFLRLFTSDYLADASLGVCSLEARGLAMEMLCLMHEGQPYGHLQLAGRDPSLPEIARLARCSDQEASDLLQELERNQVFFRSRDGLLYSPRLLQEQARRRQRSEHGKRGGNPTLIAASINRSNEQIALQQMLREQDRRDKAAARSRQYRAKKRAQRVTAPGTPAA